MAHAGQRGTSAPQALSLGSSVPLPAILIPFPGGRGTEGDLGAAVRLSYLKLGRDPGSEPQSREPPVAGREVAPSNGVPDSQVGIGWNVGDLGGAHRTLCYRVSQGTVR